MLTDGLLIIQHAKLCHGRDYFTKFNPKRYLETYYADLNHNEFEGELIPFHLETLFYIFNKALKDKIGKNSKLLDIGSGPSVHVALCAGKIFRDIYLSDLVEANRDELKKWLEYDGDAFDWSLVAKFIGDMEKVVDEVVMERAREKVKDVLECNVLESKVIKESLGKMDAVSCMFCLESASENYKQFQTAMRNVVDIIKPNGFLILGGMLNNYYYDAGGYAFRDLPLTKQQVLDTLDVTGIELEEWCEFQTPFCETNHPRSSLNAIHYVCYGRKRQ